MKISPYLKFTIGILVSFAMLAIILLTPVRYGIPVIGCSLVAICIVLGFSILKQLNKGLTKDSQQKYPRDFSLKFIASMMGFFWLTGALLYLIVFYFISIEPPTSPYSTTASFTNAEYLFRSLISSLDLFMLDVDSNVLDRLDNHEILKGLISIQSILSFGCTVVMLSGLVYSRLAAYWKIAYRTKIDDNRNHLYLFFGNNLPSSLLIKNDDNSLFKDDPKAIAVIIDEANIKDDDSSDWESIVGYITHKHKIFSIAKDSDALVAIAAQQFCDISPTQYNSPDFDAFEYVGLSSVKKLLLQLSENTAKPELHIFFMNDDEYRNIRNINVLIHDATLKHIKPRIYCHARKNGPNSVLEDLALKHGWDTRIIDSSRLTIDMLVSEPKFHPVHVMKINTENPGTVDNPFRSMIIGFGEVGRDAFRFLYEYGTFLSSESTAQNAVKAGFKCTIIDKDLDNIKGPIMAMMPGIFKSEKDTTKDIIQFKSVDYNSAEFYTDILNEHTLKNLNYIVIAVNDNDDAMTLAVRIFNLTRKVREDLSDLRIFVRCTDDSKYDSLQRVADHFNFDYGNGGKNTPVIQIFGRPKELYTFNRIISNQPLELANEYYDKYRKISGAGPSWDARHKDLSKDGNIDKLRELRRKESQDLSNARHAYTKLFLLHRYFGENYDHETFCQKYFNPDGKVNISGSYEGIYLPGLSEIENTLILNLAKLEKLRWNSAHKLLGYVFNEDRNAPDERTMRHNCLCDWSILDQKSKEINTWSCDYKKYDFCVVHTTIALYPKYAQSLHPAENTPPNP